MSDFPSNSSEALALLYLQQQDLKRLSPEEVALLYYETEIQISDELKRLSKPDQDHYDVHLD